MDFEGKAARTAALSSMRAQLEADVSVLAHVPSPRIPLTGHQWASVLDEATLPHVFAGLANRVGRLAAFQTAQGRDIAARLRPAGLELTAYASKLTRLLWQLSAFAPDGPDQPVVPLAHLTRDHARFLKRAASWFGCGLAGPVPDSPPVPPADQWRRTGVEDPLLAVFGVPTGELYDQHEAVSEARLLGLCRDRLHELSAACDGLVRSVTPSPVEMFGALDPILEILRTPRPLLAWTAANTGLMAMRVACADDALTAKTIFGELRKRDPARHASQARLAKAQAAHERATRQSERALNALSVYRIMAEGQLRPWAWTMLRLRGADGPMPMLTELRDRLLAPPEPLLRQIGDALVPALRNADAHEEGHFDELSGRLVVGDDDEVDPVVVEEANERLAALIAGLDLALACAQSQLTPVAVAYEIRPGDPETAEESLEHAAQRYGHAGLTVWSITRDRGTVHVILDELGALSYNPCFVATMQAHQLVAGVFRWQVSLRDAETPIIELPASVLAENFPVFERAAYWFDRMPVGTFLPCSTWARLGVELPGQALRAAAWWALNDVQEAIEHVEDTGELDTRLFDHRLQNVMAAIKATLRVMPVLEAQPLKVALDVTRTVRYALLGLPSAPPLEVAVREVLRERNRWMTPSALPTLDPRPIDELEAAVQGLDSQEPKPDTQLVRTRREGSEPLGGLWRPPRRRS